MHCSTLLNTKSNICINKLFNIDQEAEGSTFMIP